MQILTSEIVEAFDGRPSGNENLEEERGFSSKPTCIVPCRFGNKASAANRLVGPNSPNGRNFPPPDTRVVPGSSHKLTRTLSQARDARVPADSTAEFAEFIKSTGPSGDNGPAPLRVSTGQISPTKQSVESPRSTTTIARQRYQPREAIVDKRADNSELIDFIRQGPPSGPSNHRISRQAAPFRNAADSEQMYGAVGGRTLDGTIPEVRNSQASTSVTETSMPSMQSSVNSSSALLKNKPTSNSKMFDEDDMMPKRKTRRVRDPYALDFSDEEEEEEDDFIVTPKPPKRRKSPLPNFSEIINHHLSLLRQRLYRNSQRRSLARQL